MNKRSVGIVGGGVVGGAVKSFFPEAKVYDKFKKIDPILEVGKSQFIFICVPTPYNGEFDYSILDDAIKNTVESLSDPENQLIIIKSTAWPGTTEKYQHQYPHINFAFNPEFLRDKSANEDFIKNDRQIVGFTKKTKGHQLILELLEILPPAPYQKLVPAVVAEMIKYASNTFLALRVIFANQIYDIGHSVGVDYEDVQKAIKADKRIGESHWEIFHTESSLEHNRVEVYRGYGGKCFPKDVSSLISESKKIGVDVALFEKAREVNFFLNGGKYDR